MQLHLIPHFTLSFLPNNKNLLLRLNNLLFMFTNNSNVELWNCRSQWPRGLRRGSAAACLLVLRVRIPPRAWMSVSCECCVLSGRGLSVGLVTRPEQSYRVCGVSKKCDREVPIMRTPWSTRGCCATKKKNRHLSLSGLKLPSTLLIFLLFLTKRGLYELLFGVALQNIFNFWVARKIML
jgi:hypothetical protein